MSFKAKLAQTNQPGYALGFAQAEAEITLEQMPVRGQIPLWLTGTLLRNGPGTLQVGQPQYRHWFDGLAMLHKFSFQQGRVAYANKFGSTVGSVHTTRCSGMAK